MTAQPAPDTGLVCDWAACDRPAAVDTGEWAFCDQHAVEEAHLDTDHLDLPDSDTITVTIPVSALADDTQLLEAVRTAAATGDTARADDVRLLPLDALSRHQVAQLAGLHRTIIRNLVIGQPHASQPPASRIRRDNATRLLAVTYAPCTPVPNTATGNRQAGVTIDNTGTRRRLEALMANGWPARELARRLGHHGHALQLPKHRRVTSNTAAAIAQLYAELENTPGPNQRTRTLYRGRGYLPPGWWDPDTIDDPDAHPTGLAWRPLGDGTGPTIHLDAPRDEQVAALSRHGLTVLQIARILGASRQTVERAITRNTEAGPVKRIRRSAA